MGMMISTEQTVKRLNPCCCGRWSQRVHTWYDHAEGGNVLILVVVEDGLRGKLQLQ